MTCGWPWTSSSLEAGLWFLDPVWPTSLFSPWSHLQCHLRRSECPPRLASMPAYCDLNKWSRLWMLQPHNKSILVLLLASLCDPLRNFLSLLTSSSWPGPCSCPKPRDSTGLLVAAAQACSQHGLHVLVLGSILSVAQTLRLLALLATTRGAAATDGTVPARLKEGNKNLTCILFVLGFSTAELMH